MSHRTAKPLRRLRCCMRLLQHAWWTGRTCSWDRVKLAPQHAAAHQEAMRLPARAACAVSTHPGCRTLPCSGQACSARATKACTSGRAEQLQSIDPADGTPGGYELASSLRSRIQHPTWSPLPALLGIGFVPSAWLTLQSSWPPPLPSQVHGPCVVPLHELASNPTYATMVVLDLQSPTWLRAAAGCKDDGGLTSGWGKAGESSSRASATLMVHQEAMSSPAWRASWASLQSTHCSTRVRACRSPVRDQRKRHSRLRSAPVRLLHASQAPQLQPQQSVHGWVTSAGPSSGSCTPAQLCDS